MYVLRGTTNAWPRVVTSRFFWSQSRSPSAYSESHELLPQTIQISQGPEPSSKLPLRKIPCKDETRADVGLERSPEYPLLRKYICRAGPRIDGGLAKSTEYPLLRKFPCRDELRTGRGPGEYTEYSPLRRLPSISEPRQFFVTIHLDNLEPDTTLDQVLKAVADAGPFGLVTSARLVRWRHDLPLSCLLQFNTDSAAARLSTACKKKVFKVNGRVPFARRDLKVGVTREVLRYENTRVLRIQGPANVVGFNKDDMLHVLKTDPELKARPPSPFDWGFGHEPPSMVLMPDGDRVMTWPFFSIMDQAVPFLRALRRHFKERLRIDFGNDPCDVQRADWMKGIINPEAHNGNFSQETHEPQQAF